MKKEHPSEKLQRGECTTFKAAMETYRAQAQFEIDMFKAAIKPDDYKIEKQMRKDASVALNIYYAENKIAEQRIAQRLRSELGDIGNDFANAIESGDYSDLAI